MDPNATLKELRALVATVLVGSRDREAFRAAELFEALDGWISKGGFLPKAWERKP